MRDVPVVWAMESGWFYDASEEISGIFNHAEELLWYWYDVSNQDQSKDLVEGCFLVPELKELLAADLRTAGYEYSAVANGPISFHDLCAPNTAALIFECVDRFFRELQSEINRLIRMDADEGRSSDATDSEGLLGEYLPRVDMNALSMPPLNQSQYRSLNCTLEQELCRAYVRQIESGRAIAPKTSEINLPRASKPVWNKARSRLNCGNETLKVIRRLGNAPNVVRVLDSFEEQSWPERIDDPLPDGPDGQRLNETIRSLNTGLRYIRFRADGTGRGIVWELSNRLRDDSQTPPGF
jgi:hypothetical protein